MTAEQYNEHTQFVLSEPIKAEVYRNLLRRDDHYERRIGALCGLDNHIEVEETRQCVLAAWFLLWWS